MTYMCANFGNCGNTFSFWVIPSMITPPIQRAWVKTTCVSNVPMCPLSKSPKVVQNLFVLHKWQVKNMWFSAPTRKITNFSMKSAILKAIDIVDTPIMKSIPLTLLIYHIRDLKKSTSCRQTRVAMGFTRQKSWGNVKCGGVPATFLDDYRSNWLE